MLFKGDEHARAGPASGLSLPGEPYGDGRDGRLRMDSVLIRFADVAKTRAVAGRFGRLDAGGTDNFC